jgi:hypothetical protein
VNLGTSLTFKTASSKLSNKKPFHAFHGTSEDIVTFLEVFPGLSSQKSTGGKPSSSIK